MKNKILKVMCMLSVMLSGFAGKAFAGNDEIKSGITLNTESTAVNTIIDKFKDIVAPASAILVFASVVIVGFEIIMKRNKADERMESMSSLLWVGIGAAILGLAGTLFSFFAEI